MNRSINESFPYAVTVQAVLAGRLCDVLWRTWAEEVSASPYPGVEYDTAIGPCVEVVDATTGNVLPDELLAEAETLLDSGTPDGEALIDDLRAAAGLACSEGRRA